MPGLIPENILEDILSKVNIVELISGYIPLKKAGRNYKANCPFHHEKTPSFMVSADRQIYHCFGCGESGNAFKFIMRYERLEFPEVVEMLAKKTGVILPENRPSANKNSGITTSLYNLNELAVKFYAQTLYSPEGEQAKTYLLKRGVDKDTASFFRLGYASSRWEGLITHLRAKGVNLSLIEKAGLAVPRENQGYYDRFRNRLIFPIFDIKSRPLGLGGRILEANADLAKYVNSPETQIYTKGRHLYGLNFSKDSIRDADCAVIVEGYLDFIIPFKAGVRNIVASQGTALTIEQIRLLKRYAQKAIMVYDSDNAGQAATLRSLDLFIDEGMEVRVVSLPEGHDPDLYVRKNGVQKMTDLLNGAVSLFDYKLRTLKERYNCREIEGKNKIAQEMLQSITRFKNAVLKSEYLKRLSEELKVGEGALMQELSKISNPVSGGRVYGQTPKPQDIGINPTEGLLIRLMLEEQNALNRIRSRLEPGDFLDERASRIVSVLFDLVERGKSIEPNRLINYLEDDMIKCICESTFKTEIIEEDKDRVIDDCIQRLKNRKLLLKRQHLQEEIRLAEELGDDDKLRALQEEFFNSIKKGADPYEEERIHKERS